MIAVETLADLLLGSEETMRDARGCRLKLWGIVLLAIEILRPYIFDEEDGVIDSRSPRNMNKNRSDSFPSVQPWRDDIGSVGNFQHIPNQGFDIPPPRLDPWRIGKGRSKSNRVTKVVTEDFLGEILGENISYQIGIDGLVSIDVIISEMIIVAA